VEVAGVVTAVGDAVDGTVVVATVTYGKSVKKECQLCFCLGFMHKHI